MKHRWKLDEYGKPDEWAWESGFHNGVYCEDCGETVCVHCDQDWFEWDDCSGPPERKKKTNGDKIRSMNDDELYLWAKKQIGCGFDFFPCGVVCDGKCESYSNKDCKAKIMEWLKQPVEE